MEQLLFDREQSAAILGISANQLDHERKAGRLTPGFIGRKPVFHAEELKRFAATVALAPAQEKWSEDESLHLSA